LLTVVASVIQGTLRPSDFAARMGGDEFAVLLPATQEKDATVVLNRVRQALDRAMEQRQWPVTFSIGSETFISPLPPVDEMLGRADELMYAIKQHGKRGRATRAS
jgi:diguanylate cyclase (GGDEF)-like protein